jgi:hypothetical protein
MYYKFPKRRKQALPKLEQLPKEKTDENEAMGLIQGQEPDSKQEWITAKALERLGIRYIYQYPVNGGSQRGGYKIDFVVMTSPLATMIEIKGDHWHTGEMGADDKQRQANIESSMQDMCRIPILNLWASDLLDEETVFQRLSGEL